MLKTLQTKDYLIAGLVALALLFALYVGLSPEGIRDAPKLTLKTMDGKSVSIGGEQKRPLLVVFWATSCATCVAEIPDLKAMYADLRGDGLQIVAVAMYYDKPVDVYDMIKARKIPYAVYTDIQKKVVNAFELKTMVTPRTFLISPNGRIVYHKVGKLDMHLLRRKIVYYLKQRQTKVATH